VWDIDEETGAKLCLAIEDAKTRIDALTAALNSYRYGQTQ
jgi:hypothetical protein